MFFFLFKFTLQFARQSWLIYAKLNTMTKTKTSNKKQSELPAGPSHNCEHFFRHEYITEKSLTPGLRKACSSSGLNSAIQPINISILSLIALENPRQTKQNHFISIILSNENYHSLVATTLPPHFSVEYRWHGSSVTPEFRLNKWRKRNIYRRTDKNNRFE